MSSDANGQPKPQGHTIGFLDNQSSTESVVQRLLQAGWSKSRIVVLQGPAGIERWEAMMRGSLWGESAEDLFKSGVIELEEGHYIVSIEVADAAEAAMVADISKKLGGHSFYHFGFLTDTRLTP